MAYDARRVTFEELLVYQRAKSQRWFGRKFDQSAQRDTWRPFSPNFRGSREVWRRATKPSALFLSTAAQLDAEGLQPLLSWFELQLDVWLPVDKPDFDALESRLHDAKFKARVLRLLGDVDIQVADIRIPPPGAEVLKSVPDGNSQPQRAMTQFRMEFLYKFLDEPSAWIRSSKESASLQRLVMMLVRMLDAFDGAKLLVIDEFEIGLHPMVAVFLIQLNTSSRSPHRTQLLLNTHNVTLMDLTLLRRDQIWLMSIVKGCSSSLCTLSDHRARKKESVAKGYLRGRYGGIPKFRRENLTRSLMLPAESKKPAAAAL